MSETKNIKSRKSPYVGSDVNRFVVPDDKVDWSIEWKEYKPVDYTAPSVTKGPVWADPEIRKPNPTNLKFNAVDGKVNRVSHGQKYQIIDGLPRNSFGRTGMVGRGLLGKWGPNHAADPIVTRWKPGPGGKQVINSTSKKPVLQFVAIKRKDTGEWAIPGGMVDAGENVSLTLRREFSEETMNALEITDQEKQDVDKQLKKFFKQGFEVYRGYVDDPRNTDNSWMETIAINFHDENGTSVSKFTLNAGDDAAAVHWTDISKELRLYASHEKFVQEVAKHQKAHW